jgi:hypothetical protein
MKINVELENLDGVKGQLAAFGNSQTRILKKIVRRLATDYKKTVVRDYLSGQYLGVRTGKTKESMIAYKTKGQKAGYTIASRIQQRGEGATGGFTTFAGLANIYERPGGVDIRPKNAKVLRFIDQSGQEVFRPFVHLAARPFMTDSSQHYDFSGKFQEFADKTMFEEIQKLEDKIESD